MTVKEKAASVIRSSCESLRWAWNFILHYGLFFLPSITLLMGGALVFVKPQSFIFVLSIFLVTLGIVGMTCTWKALMLRERVQDILHKFDGRIMVQGVKLQSLEELGIELPSSNPKDQIIH